MNVWIAEALAGLAVFLAGCATAPLPPPPASATVRTGQLRYSSGETSLIADFTMRQAPDDFSLEVSKGGGMTLFHLRETPAVARFESGGRAWQGDPARAPAQIRPWLALDDALARKAGASRVEIDSPETSSRFVFVFSR